MQARRAIVACATFALAGCGSSGVGTRVDACGACANAYVPVVAGATWTYRNRVAQTMAIVHQTLAAITAMGFTTVSSSSQGSERDLWTCGAGGLADVQQHVSGGGGTISFGGQSGQTGVQNFHHYRSRGVTLPSGLDVGPSWTQVVRSASRVVGRGSVTTPAGTFDALVLTTATTRKAIPALGQHLTSVVHGTMWVVHGVGIVEATSTNSSGFVTSRTLLTYRIPGVVG